MSQLLHADLRFKMVEKAKQFFSYEKAQVSTLNELFHWVA